MNRGGWWVAILAVAAYVSVLVTVNHVRGPTDVQIPGSSTSAAPHGTLAVASLWRDLGLPFTVWSQLPAFLPVQSRAVFVSVDPAQGQYRAQDFTALRQWVRAGHEVVWVTAAPDDAIWSQFRVGPVGVRPRSERQLTAQTSQRGVGGTTPVQVWRQLRFSSQTSLSGPGLKTATMTYRTPDGRIVGAQYRVGRGTFLLWTAPSLWENSDVGQAGNFRLLWSFIGNRPLLWDEYGHGVETQGTFAFTFGHGRQFAAWLLALAAIVYVWGAIVRFGRPVLHDVESPRLGTDFMDALAWHLRSPGQRAYSAALLADAVRRRLARQVGLLAEAPWSQVDAALTRTRVLALQSPYQSWRDAWSTWQDGHRDGRQWRAFLSATHGVLQALAMLRGEVDST